jgi:hypothetical protein
MPEYRVYLTAMDGRILGPAIIFECANDREAVARTAQSTNSKALELWQDSRLVLRLPTDSC